MTGDKTATSAEALPLYFVQWLRVFLISLVVAHHAGQPYGPTGGEWPVDDPVSSPWLGPFFALNAAFFMGFFFLLSGYFAGGSFDRKGGAGFVRGRLFRLGVPLAFFTFVVFGLIAYLDAASATGFLSFFLYEYIGKWQIEMGHLWFIAMLLFFCLLYAIWRWLPMIGVRLENRKYPVPSERAILAFTIALGLVGALVRSFYPQDVWVHILWLVPSEPAHLPQYLSLFVVGIVAGRGRWFVDLDPTVGARWFLIGVLVFLFSRVFPYRLLPASITPDMMWGFLEAFICVGLILGFLVFFRKFFSKPGRWLERLNTNVFGVYVIHVFVLVGLQSAIVEIELPALVKFVIIAAAGLIINFGFVTMIRRIPGVRLLI